MAHRGLQALGIVPALLGSAFQGQEIFSKQVENQGIVDRNTLRTLDDLDRDVRRFSASFESTRGVVTTGQSALSVKAASLSNAEKSANFILEQGQTQKEGLVSRAKSQRAQLLGQAVGAVAGTAAKVFLL